jgi:hypothetical protein
MTFLREQHAFRLSQAAVGQTVRVVLISEVVEDETAVLRSLNDTKIHPRALLTVEASDPAGGVTFTVTGERRTVAHDLAAKIWVAAAETQAEAAS